MKNSSKKSKMFTTISVIIVTLIIALLANWFQYAAGKAVIDTTVREMEENGKQQKFTIEEILKEYKDDLTRLAEYIARENIDETNIVEYLNTQAQAEEFDVLYYIDTQGNGVSVDNTEKDFSENQTYMRALEGDYYISIPEFTFDYWDVVLDICVPVIKNNEVVAVLFSELSVGDFFEFTQMVVNEKGDLFILDYNLNMIFSSNANHEGMSAIPDGDMQEMGVENVLNAQAEILAGLSGSFHYDYYGDSKVMIYMPIDMTEWVVAMNVETNIINRNLAIAVEQLKIICQAIYWFLIGLIVYIWFSQNRSMKELEKTAYYDSLTLLPNMAKLKKDMKEILAHNKAKRFSIAIFDIENFKVFNEMYGFEMGDRLLKNMKPFSETLQVPNLIFARTGADKFAVFAETEVLSDINLLIAKGIEYFDETLPELKDHDATFKCGRYEIELGETDVDGVINKVIIAHKTAKETESMLLCEYDETLKTKILNDADIANKMRIALKNKEFKLFLQPKFSVTGDKLIGAEALVRWIEPDGSIIYPDSFIPLFEKNGFILELDEYILETTCAMLKKWNDKGFEYLPISVNCSRLNINKPNFVEDIVAIVDKYNVPHKFIEIEITESTTTDNEEILQVLFTKLRALGFKISIDDFGSGYSSLSMLKNLKVDTLKMDRSFFIDDTYGGRSDLLVDGVVKLAHNLNMYVVAEGIETLNQIDMLKNLKCDAVQGYFYAKPMATSDFEEKYADIMPKDN